MWSWSLHCSLVRVMHFPGEISGYIRFLLFRSGRLWGFLIWTFLYQKVLFINTTLYQIFSSLCGKWKILSLCDIWLVLVCSRSHHEGLGIRIHHVLFIFSSWRTNHILLGDWKQPIFRQFYSSKIQIHLTQFFFNKDSINIHQSQSFFLSLARSE